VNGVFGEGDDLRGIAENAHSEEGCFNARHCKPDLSYESDVSETMRARKRWRSSAE